MDYTTDGVADVTSPAAPLTTTYSTSGLSTATLTITDTQNHVYQAAVAIEVMDKTAADNMLKGTWTSMSNALVAGDKSLALTYLTEPARATFSPVWDLLLGDMGQIMGSVGLVRPLSISGNLGLYAITRTVGGQQRVYLISFMRDEDGVWRIGQM